MPLLTVIAGPNGSGKSTLIETLVSHGLALGRYLNADDIARDLTGSPEDVSRQAQQIVREQRDSAACAGQDHAFETVMSHPSHIDHMNLAASLGFEVRLIFIATDDPALNLGRVANRVIHGGHDVPADRIVHRYHRCLDNLPAAIKASHRCAIYDNSLADVPVRLLAEIGTAAGVSQLRHTDELDYPALPVWWLRILLQIKPDAPLADGPLL